MSLIKKTYQIPFFLIILFLLSSCKEQCYNADQFDSYSVVVESKPTNDGIQSMSITKDSANWHETDLRSNGDEFIIRVTGEWTAWAGYSMNESTLKGLPVCLMCARKNDGTSKNCICLKGQEPKAYPTKQCNKGNYDHENDPTSCTCTTDPNEGWDADERFNLAYAENIQYTNLDYYDKNGIQKIADQQVGCKFTQGAGLYIGLFGPSGTVMPSRAYHLYSPVEVCNVIPARDTKTNELICKDSNGNNRTSYEFRSKNNRIFMRDDNSGNQGTDTNPDDDIYHTSNEVIKFKISDEEYSNNFGQYNIQILRGVGDSSDRSQVGILEYMVRLVEDVLLGEINNNDERVGGIIEFMYKAIVQDSGFMGFLRMCLILYVSIYGMAVLAGVAEISKKELMSRILKIGLVLLFTSANSWQIYRDIVVGFFLDGMNSVITMINSMSLQALDINSSASILDAQLDRSSNVSSSTRFTYIDNTIIMLMSEASAAKIFGLILASPFGVLYVVAIYALIAIFIAVMAYAATVYLINMLKIIFVLSLGPIFIVFVLFGQTAQMFKNWISFLAGRSMEIVILFLVLYSFVVILNTTFIEMLSYETCVETLNLYIFKLRYLKSYIDRSLMEWISFFMKILGLSFITYLVLEKVGDISGQLISVGGAGNQNAKGEGRGGSGFALASKFLSTAAKGAAGAAGKVALASAYAGLGASKVASVAARETGLSGAMSAAARSAGRATGLSQLSKAIGQRAPLALKNPRQFLRDRKYRGMIKQATKDINRRDDTKGLTGAERDQAIRSRALEIFENSKMNSNLANSKVGSGEMHTYNMLGLGYESFSNALNKELVEKPLLKAIDQKTKELQNGSDPKFGKEMEKELRDFTSKWMKENSVLGEDGIKSALKDKDNFDRSKFEFQLHNKIKNGSKLSPSKAAKAFHGDEKKQREYLSHLQDRANEQKSRTDNLNEKRSGSLAPIRWASKASGAAYRAGRSFGFESARPDLAQRNFARNVENQKARNDGSTFSKYGTSRYWGNKLNLTNRNDKTAAIAAALNRNIGKPLGKKIAKLQATESRRDKVIKNNLATITKGAGKIASAPYKGYKYVKNEKLGLKENSKIKAEQRAQKTKAKDVAQVLKKDRASFRTDRQTSLGKQERTSLSILREKLSSKDSANKAITSNSIFQTDLGKTREEFNKDELTKEREGFEANRFEREVMQKQLRDESISVLKSKMESMTDNGLQDSKSSRRNRLDGLIEDRGSLSKLIDGDPGKDNIIADSAFEKAARLQYLNEYLGLGERNFERDLLEKFNERMNGDIENTQKAMKDALENGDLDAYNKYVKDLEEIQSSKASLFSDFSDKEAGDGRYKEFFSEYMQESLTRFQALKDGKRYPSGKDDQLSSDKKAQVKDQSRILPYEDSKDLAAKSMDNSVERTTYYNDRDITDKLAQALDSNSIKSDREKIGKISKENEEEIRFSSSRKNAKKSIDDYYSNNLEELRNTENKSLQNSKRDTIIRRAQKDINTSFETGNSNLLNNVVKYDALKEEMGMESNMAGKFNQLINEQADSLSKSIADKAKKSEDIQDDLKSLERLKELHIGLADKDALQDKNVKQVLESMSKAIEEDRKETKGKEIGSAISDESLIKEMDSKVKDSRSEIQKTIDEYKKGEDTKSQQDTLKDKESPEDLSEGDLDLEIVPDDDNGNNPERKGNDLQNNQKAISLQEQQAKLGRQKQEIADKQSKLSSQIAEIDAQIKSLKFDDPKIAELESQKGAISNELEVLQSQVNNLDNQIQNVIGELSEVDGSNN
ncbi:MAG: type IV secretion system protein [Rickettsiales bacterium]|nr:type IV secretion system protein [Rickettsiales bacterium]